MEYLMRFSQSHESFRLAEIQALATLEGIELEISPFCVIKVADDDAATRLVRRSLLAQSIHSLWGRGDTLDEFYADISRRAAPLWPPYVKSSFKLESDAFQGKRSNKDRLALIDSFGAVLPLDGDIDMRNPELVLTVFEHWTFGSVQKKLPDPEHFYMGRFVANTARDASLTFDLKKRRYIATTSMDAELSLLTANLALAAPGKLFYDPFVGTGSFPLAAAHWGATAWGSDIDGRAVRGSAAGINGAGGSGGSRTGRADVRGNFEQYGLLAAFGDVFTADLTHIPLRCGAEHRWIDGIICDPPYGVREGPRVLGVRNPEKKPWAVEAGKKMYKDPTFIPPKQPYSFMALLNDLMCFAADTLVDNARLSFWMPTANDEAQELPVPTHPCLELISVCTQVFNKWSRRLITFRRLPNSEVDADALALATRAASDAPKLKGQTANDLNPFRKSYFSKFEVSGNTASSSGDSTPAKTEPIAETPDAPPASEAPTATATAANGSIPRPDSRPGPAMTSVPTPAPD
ncbi:hypothetical protein HMPREF1624_02670 [Sporothrix schenckii ATCC 58251]|uniref:tRNA (guanine(10)-N(2))-methyltransferase n=1 Tax=Sporothrix schenckii (strain ATCC 58251 / de Perez 2211183) TaxID=1391915 RepID=U7Q0L7_SPOS1|nr:hypothetical protein HMPREF1624_02670 [Sporothrix schenckii ATCC 58251]